ncbi:hypothetical protein BE15_38005 [Sorangium cellulosum]|uniref:Uncharacterized protein n=1 Tax=Sorangium cellulosum TaxID=56 RepID=A0A150QHH7_SORCE|nr:hypothetical protein BE15_38005 [Sorangium cellulosum]KYF81160.1 hypothetical protein BE11_18730 [Sorangium cellulosum]
MNFVDLAMPQRRQKSFHFQGDTAWAADERGGLLVLRGGLRGLVAAGVSRASVTCVHSALARRCGGARPRRSPGRLARRRGVVDGARWHEDQRTR